MSGDPAFSTSEANFLRSCCLLQLSLAFFSSLWHTTGGLDAAIAVFGLLGLTVQSGQLMQYFFVFEAANFVAGVIALWHAGPWWVFACLAILGLAAKALGAYCAYVVKNAAAIEGGNFQSFENAPPSGGQVNPFEGTFQPAPAQTGAYVAPVPPA